MRNSPFLGVSGGILCIFAGAMLMFFGFQAVDSGQSMVPRAMYYAVALYFIGKGCFAAGVSLNTTCGKGKVGENP